MAPFGRKDSSDLPVGVDGLLVVEGDDEVFGLGVAFEVAVDVLVEGVRKLQL